MSFVEKLKKFMKELFEPAPAKDEMSELEKQLEEERKAAREKAAEEKRLKQRIKMLTAGMTDEEIDAYDPACANAMPSGGKVKVMIVSDTHGHVENLYKALKAEKPIDLLIHCGDICDDEDIIQIMAGCPCKMVSGNMDFSSRYPERDVFEIGKHRFMLVHGHRYDVHSGIGTLSARAMMEKAEVVFFGHTHMPVLTEDRGVIVVNPGSVAKPRQGDGKYTYAIMEFDADSDEKPVITIKDVPDGIRAKFNWDF